MTIAEATIIAPDEQAAVLGGDVPIKLVPNGVIRPACGFAVEWDEHKYTTKLCGETSVIFVNMREMGTLWLCARHWSKKARQWCEERGYVWAELRP